MIYDVGPVDGDVIGKASSCEEAWTLCSRYGLAPYSLTDAGVIDLEIADDETKVWRVRCAHKSYPYDRIAYENRRRDSLAAMESGLPAWPVAEENGIAFQTFTQRLKGGWSGERAATEGAREITHDPNDEWEVEALANGMSVVE